ncbi:tetratricopeptide repeat protein [Fulvivirgaceae bacterium BMA10]|uniref:Tetratricopeptide repeat protein n=1 Tax=Splendidivirga corallicola TaxID=3051826 RepID=A0ABT8KSX2_9BACT|nr:tetratricopeptide repeat protein [Fulvivirgaceae bacterium BMA10]
MFKLFTLLIILGGTLVVDSRGGDQQIRSDSVTDKKNNPDSIVILADKFYKAREFRKAATLYESRLKINDSSLTVIKRSRLYIKLASSYRKLDQTENARSVLKKALSLIDPTHSEYVSIIHNNLGNIAFDEGDFKTSIEHYEKSLEISRSISDSLSIAKRLKSLGIVYKNMSHYSRALNLYRESVHILVTLDNDKELAATYDAIANVFEKTEEFQNSLTHHFKALELQEKIGYERGVAGSLNNIGNVYLETNLTDSAIIFYEKSLSIKKRLKLSLSESVTLNNLGEAYFKKGDLKKANQYFHQSLTIRKNMHDKKGIATSSNNLAELFFVQKQYTKSINFLVTAGVLARQMQLNNVLLRNLDLGKKIYGALGQYEKVAALDAEYDQLKEHLFNEEKVKVLNIRALMEKEEVEKNNELLEQEILLKELETENQRILSIAFIVLFVGVSVVLVVIISTRRKIVRKNKELLDKNRIINAQKADIQHQTNNGLQRVQNILKTVSKGIDDEDILRQVKNGENMILALSSLSEFLYEARDHTEIVMKDFLQELTSKLLTVHNKKPDEVSFHMDISPIVLAFDTAVPIALIISEVVTNAFKHAFAETEHPAFSISFSEQDKKVKLIIQDNGKGYSKNELKNSSKHFGRTLISKYVDILGGRQKTHYQNGQGSIFELVFQCQKIGTRLSHA